MSEFKREDRYLVLKRVDIQNAVLGEEALRALGHICDCIESARRHEGKPPLKCVIVESDWPEYEPTWAAIEKREAETTEA